MSRELLELAAKAAGYELHWGFTDSMIRCNEPEHPGKTHNLWNPLKDDADAFRLAVKLAMTVMVNPESKEAIAFFFGGVMAKEPCACGEDTAPVRRAIVRCAAIASPAIVKAKNVSASVTGGRSHDAD